MGTLFPYVQKMTVYVDNKLKVDHLDTLQLPRLKEIGLKSDPNPYGDTAFRECVPLCERICSSLSRIEKVSFTDLPIGVDDVGQSLGKLMEHPNLTQIR